MHDAWNNFITTYENYCLSLCAELIDQSHYLTRKSKMLMNQYFMLLLPNSICNMVFPENYSYYGIHVLQTQLMRDQLSDLQKKVYYIYAYKIFTHVYLCY